MAVYDTMNLKNKGGAVPTYQRSGSDVYTPGANRNARLQSDTSIQQQTGEAITRTANNMRAMDMKRMELISRGLELEKGALDATVKAGERVASGMEKVVAAFENYQDKYSDVKASELALQYRMKLRELLYKDDGTGLMQTQQEGARDAGKNFQSGANDLMEDMLSEYGNDVRGKFFAKVNEFNISQWDSVNQHEASEMKKWEINTLTAEAQNFGDLAVENSDKPQLMADYLAQSSNSYRNAYMAAGFSGEALDRKILEHTSANIAFAIKKNIKNNIGRAETMLAGATKYMTAKDINDVENSILAQKNYLETKALRAEQAAIAREERANRKFYAEIQKPIKDTMALLWNGGEAEGDNIQKIYDGLIAHGFVEQAEAFKSDVDTALTSREVIRSTANLSIPELENKIVAFTDNFSKNLDINGKPMTTKAEIDKMRTIITGLNGSLTHKTTLRNRDPVAYSRSKDNPTMTPFTQADGSVTKADFFQASLESQRKDHVKEYELGILTKDELKQAKFDIENSNEPFTVLNKLFYGLNSEQQRILLRQLEDAKVSVREMGVLSTIDPALANEYYHYMEKKKNPETNMSKYGSEVLQSKLTKVKAISESIIQNRENKDVLETFLPEQQAMAMKVMEGLGELFVVKDSKQYDEATAAKTAFDTILGRYQIITLNGSNLRIPAKGIEDTKIDGKVFKFNLQSAINEFYNDRESQDFKTIFRGLEGEALNQAVKARADNTILVNDGKGGYIFAYKDTGKLMVVGYDSNEHFIRIDKTDDELSTEQNEVKLIDLSNK